MPDVKTLVTRLQESLKILQAQKESSAGSIESERLKQVEEILNALVQNLSRAQELNSSVTIGDITGGLDSSIIAGRDVLEILIQAGDVGGSQKIIEKLDLLVEVLSTKVAGEKEHEYPGTSPLVVQPIVFPNILNSSPIRKSKQGDDIPDELGRCSSAPSDPEPTISPLQYDSHIGRLQNLLQAQKWQEADRETIKVILTIARNHDEGELVGGIRAQDMKNFPCPVLQMIDKLWSEASDGKFGLNSQRQIWYDIARRKDMFERKQFAKKVRKFGERVGWRINSRWLESYEMLTFTLNAPNGHLPSFRLPAFEQEIGVMTSWQNNFRLLLCRLEHCLSQKPKKPVA